MKERPILFSGEMVRAILDGRKTQTRRVIKLNKFPLNTDHFKENYTFNKMSIDGINAIFGWNGFIEHIKCPYGKPGDELWVKHSWYHYKPTPTNPDNEQAWDEYTKTVRWIGGQACIDCEPCVDAPVWKKKGPRFMPRWASRIQLLVKDIRVERVQEIKPEDIKPEGIKLMSGEFNRDMWDRWKALWDSINKKRGYGWNENPWVWVIEFERIRP